jgi:hypothetical protein
VQSLIHRRPVLVSDDRWSNILDQLYRERWVLRRRSNHLFKLDEIPLVQVDGSPQLAPLLLRYRARMVTELTSQPFELVLPGLTAIGHHARVARLSARPAR